MPTYFAATYAGFLFHSAAQALCDIRQRISAMRGIRRANNAAAVCDRAK